MTPEQQNPYLKVGDPASDDFHAQYQDALGYYHYHAEDGLCTDVSCMTSVPRSLFDSASDRN